MAIRQARLEPLVLSVSGHERIVNGGAVASGEERFDFSAGIARFGDIMNRERSISFGSRGDPCCSRKCLPLKMIPASRLVIRT